MVDAGDVVTVGLSLGSQSSCSTFLFSRASFCSAIFDVDAFSFTTTGPVFNLPAGWTANSADGRIVNNVLVPEPSTGLLVLTGLLGLAARRKRE
jgi:hypothetical protein